MNQTDALAGKIHNLRITRSRYHYKPISSLELTLTTVLSVFIGLGMFMLTTIAVPQGDFELQVESEATEQCAAVSSPNRCQNL